MVKLTKTKDEIIKKSNELAIQYEAKYKGCGECAFMAVLDALRWGGLEIIPKEMEDRLFSGVCVTTAGIGLICDGNCGAVASGALVIGLALGIYGGPHGGPLYLLNLQKGFATVRNTLVKTCYQKYNSILCTAIQRKWFGKAWDLTRDDMNMEFLGITHGCAIMEITMWTTEIILDELEKGNVKGYVGSPQGKA
ncbi:MAG TPA: hypothetical protein VIH69_05475 [Dehalococcoidia bacterium]